MGEDKSAEVDKKKEEPQAKTSKAEEKENELSEEDQRLKDDLNLMVTRLEDSEPGLVANALMVGPIESQLYVSKLQTLLLAQQCKYCPFGRFCFITSQHRSRNVRSCVGSSRLRQAGDATARHPSCDLTCCAGDRIGDQDGYHVDDFRAKASEIPEGALPGHEGRLRAHAAQRQPQGAGGRLVGARDEFRGRGRPGKPPLPARRLQRVCRRLGT